MSGRAGGKCCIDSQFAQEINAGRQPPAAYIKQKSWRGGVGLSIAHMVAQAHPGTRILRNGEQGGLIATLILPPTTAAQVRAAQAN